MTLKFPLINLISRGHLPLTNRTACLNFAKNVEDGPATRICYEMMKCNDPRESAKFLEEAVRVYQEMNEGSRAYFAESRAFVNARNMILMKEDANQVGPEPSLNGVGDLIRLIKYGGMSLAVAKFLALPQAEQQVLKDNLKKYSKDLYNIFQDNLIGRHVLPKDPKFFIRLYNSALRTSGTRLKDVEKDKLKTLGKRGGIAATIAVGTIAAAVAISMTYKRFFSKEAKVCKNFSGKQRTICLTQARIKACDVAIEQSKKALLECSSAKDEQDCIFKMKVEIRSWSKKKALEEEKLRKLTNVNRDSFETQTNKNDPFA